MGQSHFGAASFRGLPIWGASEACERIVEIGFWIGFENFLTSKLVQRLSRTNLGHPEIGFKQGLKKFFGPNFPKRYPNSFFEKSGRPSSLSIQSSTSSKPSPVWGPGAEVPRTGLVHKFEGRAAICAPGPLSGRATGWVRSMRG